MTSNPVTDEAIGKMQAWLAYVKELAAPWAPEPEIEEFEQILRLAMQAAHTPPSDDNRELEAALRPFWREAGRWNMEPSALKYSFANTGLSRGDIKRAADLYVALSQQGGEKP